MTLRSSLAALVVVALSLSGCRDKKSSKDLPSPMGLAPPAIPTLSSVGSGAGAGAAASAAGSDTDHISGTGTLEPRAQAQIGPKSTGILTSIRVDEGDAVKKGQVLFTLDSSQAYIGVQQAKAGVQVAQVGYDSAQLDFKRTKDLLAHGSVAPAIFDGVKARYDAAKARLAQAKAGLAMARRYVSDTVLRSPLSGVVTMKLKNVGETVTMMPPTVVLVVQDIDVLELHAHLPERALSYVKAGDALRVHIPALDTEREVTVKRVNPSVDPRTRTIEIVAELDNKDHKLKSGMLVEVRYDVAKQSEPPKRAEPGAKRPAKVAP